MKGYRFRLAQVQRVRSVQERQAAAALGAARRAEVAAATIAVDRRNLLAGLGRAPFGPRPAADGRSQGSLLDLGHRELRRADAAADDARDRADVEHQAWSVAARSLRGLELLDERRRAEHAIEAARDEARAVDDLTGARHHEDEP